MSVRKADFTIRNVGLLLALMSCLVGCGSSHVPPPGAVSLNPHDWNILYSSGTPSHPSKDAQGAWSLTIPAPGHVNYVQTPFNASTITHNVYVTFRVDSEAPQYKVMDPADIAPATFHVFFEQKNDDLTTANG